MKTKIKKDEDFEYIKLIESPLYQKFIFEPIQLNSPTSKGTTPSYKNWKPTVDELENPTTKFKCFCIQCNEERIFKITDKYSHTENWIKSNAGGFRMFNDGIRYHEFECSLDSQHRIYLTYKVGKDYIMKIGQYPSSADLEKVPKEYKNILGEEKYFEMKRAEGLKSFGVGVGSFVYLRRIIEFLIDRAYKKAKTEIMWDDEKYQRERVKERIKLLKNHLPDFFVNNSLIYGIISKGIHELGEKDCLLYFPVLKNSIELILDEEIEKQKKEKKKKELSKSINHINSELTENN